MMCSCHELTMAAPSKRLDLRGAVGIEAAKFEIEPNRGRRVLASKIGIASDLGPVDRIARRETTEDHMAR
jgi:hypothetical protein